MRQQLTIFGNHYGINHGDPPTEDYENMADESAIQDSYNQATKNPYISPATNNGKVHKESGASAIYNPITFHKQRFNPINKHRPHPDSLKKPKS